MRTKPSRSEAIGSLLSKISNSPLLDGKQDMSIKMVSTSISNLPLKRIDPTCRLEGLGQGEYGV